MAVVIKKDSESTKKTAARDVSGLAGFNLSDLAAEGRSQLDECRTKIGEMLEQARQQADALRAEAEQQGHQAGIERAQAELAAQINQAAETRAKESLELIRTSVEQMHSVYESWMQQYAETLSAIALRAAERIVMRTLDSEPQLVAAWAAEALRSTRAATSLTVAVHPETLAQLGAIFDKLLSASDLPEQTQLVADETIGITEVVVRQSGGEIQAGLQAQLSRLQELLS